MYAQLLRSATMPAKRFRRLAPFDGVSFGYGPFGLFATCSFLPLQGAPPYPIVSREGKGSVQPAVPPGFVCDLPILTYLALFKPY